MNIVVLDGATTNLGDLSWKDIAKLGSLQVFDHTSDNDIINRSKEADILICNKVKISKSHLIQLPRLKCICLLATGYDNIDVLEAKNLRIAVYNAVGYSTDSVAQHVFALILQLTNAVGLHNQLVQEGEWQKEQWSFTRQKLYELTGKTLGIIGYGKIGRKVIEMAEAFKMKIVIAKSHRTKRLQENSNRVNLTQLFRSSDIVSLHLPLTTQTRGMIDQKALRLMKPSALLINTARGGLIVENDLREALLTKEIQGAALDVLSSEPPPDNHPLIGLRNCIITPHIAWATLESRKRLLSAVCENISNFLSGSSKNRVN